MFRWSRRKLMLSRIAMCFAKAQMGLEVKSSLSLSDNHERHGYRVSQIRAKCGHRYQQRGARKTCVG